MLLRRLGIAAFVVCYVGCVSFFGAALHSYSAIGCIVLTTWLIAAAATFKRPWRFSIGTMLVATTFIAIALGLYAMAGH